MKDAELDSIDKNILLELSRDARMPFAELGRRVGLSPSASNERVRQLESLGIIQGYCASIDLKTLGFRITAVYPSHLRRTTVSALLEVLKWP